MSVMERPPGRKVSGAGHSSRGKARSKSAGEIEEQRDGRANEERFEAGNAGDSRVVEELTVLGLLGEIYGKL